MTTDTEHPPAAQAGHRNDVHDLRAELFAAIRGVRDGSVDTDKARTINELGKTLTDLARAETDAMRVTGETRNTFITPAPDDEPKALPNGITGIRRHVLKG